MSEVKQARASKKRNTWLIISAMSIIILVLGGLAVWRYDARLHGWGKIAFQEYAPTYLPDQLTIAQKTIDAIYTPANNPSHITELHMRLSKNSFIYEGTMAPFDYNCGLTADNQTCVINRTAAGQQYTLTTLTLSGQSPEQTVEWARGKTYIRVVLSNEHSQPYTQQEIDKMVDSFTPVTYQNLPVNYYDHSKV